MNDYQDDFSAPAVRNGGAVAPIAGMNAPALAGTTSQVAIQERLADVQMRYMMARQFPRRLELVEHYIRQACQQPGLAEVAEYALPVSGSTVRGPSIRLAESLAQAYGNLDITREVIATGKDERGRWSDVRVLVLDLESGNRFAEVMRIHHIRYSKTKGDTHINDLGELERIFSQHAAKRLRECIFRALPRDLVNKARAWCAETVRNPPGAKPLIERIRGMVLEFERLGIKRDQLEKRVGCGIDLWTNEHFADMKAIFVSIREDASKAEEWFPDPNATAEGDTAAKMRAQAQARKAKSEEPKEGGAS